MRPAAVSRPTALDRVRRPSGRRLRILGTVCGGFGPRRSSGWRAAIVTWVPPPWRRNPSTGFGCCRNERPRLACDCRRPEELEPRGGREADSALRACQKPGPEELIMKYISADFNAMTEAGHVRLTLPCSREDIVGMGLGTGDWAWLSDGELVVGAQLAVDDRYGLVGVPDWDTLVHLDEEDAGDFQSIGAALEPLLAWEPPSEADQSRIFQLLTLFEHVAPRDLPRVRSGGSRLSPGPGAATDGKARSGVAGGTRCTRCTGLTTRIYSSSTSIS